MRNALTKAMALTLPILIAGCGGGGGGNPSPAATTVAGKVFAADVAGAGVVVKNASGSVVAGPVISGNDGSYSIEIPDAALAGGLVLESAGGQFTDEATGTAGVAGGRMSAYVGAGSVTAGSKVYMTPQSTILRNLVPGAGTLSAAENIFNSAFGYTPDISVRPVVVTAAPPAGTTDAQKLEGLRAASFSQLALDLGLAPAGQFQLLQALADDLADGVLDGMNSSVAITAAPGTAIPADVQNRYEAAFITAHTNNWSTCGLMADKIGFLPFAKTALSATYRFEYIPGARSPAEGKTRFQIRISNRNDGSAAAGLTVSLLPRMVMSGQYGHYSAVPPDGVVESSTPGTYDATVFYVMAGETAGGQSLGYWQLQVTAGGESVSFYPRVAAAGNDTPKVGLRSNADLFVNGGVTVSRLYYLWNDALSVTGGNGTFGILITAADGYFQPIAAGAALTDQNGASWTVNSLTVQASTDGVTWSPMTCGATARCTVSGLAGLSTGVQGAIYVKMNINGADYTTNGSAASGSNAYATFTVTP